MYRGVVRRSGTLVKYRIMIRIGGKESDSLSRSICGWLPRGYLILGGRLLAWCRQ